MEAEALPRRRRPGTGLVVSFPPMSHLGVAWENPDAPRDPITGITFQRDEDTLERLLAGLKGLDGGGEGA